MKNITLSVPEDIARWARIEAAKRETSVSRMLCDVLRRSMEEAVGYQEAMREFLSEEPLALGGRRYYPSREELHERNFSG